METRHAVLALLHEREGEAVSGQEIADKLGISRTAVSKAVKTLTKNGYSVSAQTNKGYTLEKDTDVFTLQEIKKHYNYPAFFEDCTQSTNQTAKMLAANSAEHGTLCAAASQTKGCGRRGKSFYSPALYGVYFSVILKNVCLENAGVVTTAAAVATVRVIKRLYDIQLSIKWVNDLFYKGKKVCGILTQATADFETGQTEHAVVGIGINLYEPPEGFPPEISKVAGAIFESGQKCSRALICSEIALELLKLCEGNESFMDEYIEHSCILGKKISILRNGEISEAVAVGITRRGHLQVKYDNGKKDTLYFGEVSII